MAAPGSEHANVVGKVLQHIKITKVFEDPLPFRTADKHLASCLDVLFDPALRQPCKLPRQREILHVGARSERHLQRPLLTVTQDHHLNVVTGFVAFDEIDRRADAAHHILAVDGQDDVVQLEPRPVGWAVGYDVYDENTLIFRIRLPCQRFSHSDGYTKPAAVLGVTRFPDLDRSHFDVAGFTSAVLGGNDVGENQNDAFGVTFAGDPDAVGLANPCVSFIANDHGDLDFGDSFIGFSQRRRQPGLNGG